MHSGAAAVHWSAPLARPTSTGRFRKALPKVQSQTRRPAKVRSERPPSTGRTGSGVESASTMACRR